MRRDVRAVFIDEKERAARGEAASVRDGEVVQRDGHGQDRGDDEIAATLHAMHDFPSPLVRGEGAAGG
jgi:hypothetical protein